MGGTTLAPSQAHILSLADSRFSRSIVYRSLASVTRQVGRLGHIIISYGDICSAIVSRALVGRIQGHIAISK